MAYACKNVWTCGFSSSDCGMRHSAAVFLFIFLASRILLSEARTVLGEGMNRMVLPVSGVGVGEGSHFCGDPVALESDRNIPAVPLTSKPRDHFLFAFCCRLQNRSGFRSSGLFESSCRGSGIGVVRSGGNRSSSHCFLRVVGDNDGGGSGGIS